MPQGLGHQTRSIKVEGLLIGQATIFVILGLSSLHNFLFQPRRAFVENCQKLLGQPLQEVISGLSVDVGEPFAALRR